MSGQSRPVWAAPRNLYRKLEDVDFDQFLPRIGFLGRSEPASAELQFVSKFYPICALFQVGQGKVKYLVYSTMKVG